MRHSVAVQLLAGGISSAHGATERRGLSLSVRGANNHFSHFLSATASDLFTVVIVNTVVMHATVAVAIGDTYFLQCKQ